ncbi:hypothetical protein SCA03_14120 [Streptomyces cacaoi]|uniref:SWIM-type domain-containing protein n=4 Tax=Streptomyces cacaoi TaxID=1898 RepID=A0A4Y3QUE5_STRCI|nr:hypothetical protein SCA03_14120 [Streptomyces cacaoi]
MCGAVRTALDSGVGVGGVGGRALSVPVPTVVGMGGQTVRWTAEQISALAPDAASRKAGSKLSTARPWSATGTDGSAVWGLCKGSGSRPYQTVVDLDGGQGPGYKCSCPSRKFPCKHALGLLLLWAQEPQAVPDTAEEPPEWAGAWLESRSRRAARKAEAARAAAEAGAGGAASGRAEDGAGARGEAPGGADGARAEAARRRARQRAERMAAGAEELEQRLADVLRGGLADADRAGYAPWEETAARMVDAQAPGLAARVRELGSVPASGEGWPERLLAECALLHLLARAYRRIDTLPEAQARTVESRVGRTVEAADVLADDSARIRDGWLVLAQRDAEEGRLLVRRIWLYGQRTGRPALLLSYGAAGRAPEQALPVGATLDAELAYYPGAGPLRAALGERHGAPVPGFRPPGGTIPEALDAYGQALAQDPWLEGWPVVLREVAPVPPPADRDDTGTTDAQWQLASADGDFALPVAPWCAPATLWKLTALSAEGPLTVFGECGHRGFTPHTAWTGSTTTAVPL